MRKSATVVGLLLVSGLVLGASCLANAASALEIALTNDDGWSAPGIQAMKDALLAAGHTVTLAAPLTNQSGSGAAVDLAALKITKQAANEYSVALLAGGSAKPATSGLIAIGIVQEQGHPPDLLISGINAGNNLGSFAQASGTVGAAILAASATFNGAVPAIAISTDVPTCTPTPACQEEHYGTVAQFVTDLVAHLETKPGFLASEAGLLPKGIALNVNYPATDQVSGVVVAVQGQTAQSDGTQVSANFRCLSGGPCSTLPVGGSAVGAPVVVADNTPDIKNADTTYYKQGYVTIVPMMPDYTADNPLEFKSALAGFESP